MSKATHVSRAPARASATTRLGAGTTAGLALLAAGPSAVSLLVAAAIGPAGLLNDFHSYWYAGRLLAEGASPYDLAALRALAEREGDVFVLGTGFSYPLPFAVAMIPLSALPFGAAAALFVAFSLAVFAAAVAGWLRRFHAAAPPANLRAAALIAGTSPPIIGSVLNGQVNLLVLGALAMGAALTLERSPWKPALGGVAIGLAAVVKLVPGALAVPLWLARGGRSAAWGLIAGILVPLAVSAAAWPGVLLDSTELAVLFEPDPFITNQSINGFVSRLVLGSDRMTAMAPGAFDPAPVVAILTLGLAAATGLILWRARREMATAGGLAIGLALTLVGATAGAPKTSLWNVTLVLVAIGLLLAVAAPDLGSGGLGRVERHLVVAWWASTLIQPLVWVIPPQAAGSGAALVVACGSLSLYGNLALWWLFARRLVARKPERAVAARA